MEINNQKSVLPGVVIGKIAGFIATTIVFAIAAFLVFFYSLAALMLKISGISFRLMQLARPITISRVLQSLGT